MRLTQYLTFLVRRMRFSPATGLALLLAASVRVSDAQPAFSERTQAAGLSFNHGPLADTPGSVMHGGGAVGDFNKDGWPDLFVVGGGAVLDALFINNGNGTFTNRASQWGITDLYRGNGASAGDFNKDGWLDLFVTSFGDLPGDPQNGKHRLYRNNGNGTFTNVATAAGVNWTAPNPDGYGSTWGDYDLDGDLDLWVGAWHDSGGGFVGGNRLFRNNGNGSFTDVTAQLGLFTQLTHGFGAIFADMDGDRYPELMVAGDFGTSRYYANNRNGTFTPVNIIAPGDTKVHNGMGTTVGDFNRDGLLDWFVTAIFPAWRNEGPPGNRLYLNQGNHQFRSAPQSAGVNNGGWGWGTVALDCDHDAWLDIVMTNGWQECPDPVTGACFLDDPTMLFHNDGVGNGFSEMGQASGVYHTLQGRGLVHFDYDRDGDMDLVNFTNDGELFLFRNDLSGPNTHWLEVVLDSSANSALAPNGWGANITITDGGITQTQRINGGANYLSTSELIAHFGTSVQLQVDELVVTWADGFRTALKNIAADQLLTIAAKLPYTHTPFVRGQQTQLAVEGLLPGEEAMFGWSLAGKGSGPCLPQAGGLCLDMLSPKVLGSAPADAQGVAKLTLTIPASARVGTAITTQALVIRGTGGIRSLKTNVDTSTIASAQLQRSRSQPGTSVSKPRTRGRIRLWPGLSSVR